MSLDSAKKVTTAIIGANGMLARMVQQRAPVNYALHLFDLPQFDLTNRGQVLEILTGLNPDVIINCAAYTNVDGAETEEASAMLVNGTSVGFLAEVAKNVEATLVHVSTDYVFDGTKLEPYSELDPPNPQSVYGRSKLLGEQSVVSSGLINYFIVRTSWLYGPYGHNFVETILRLAAEREELRIIDDQVGSPTYTADLADAIFSLLKTGEPPSGDSPYGIYHFADAGECSWYEFACEIIGQARSHDLACRVRTIHPIRTEDYPLPAKRPRNSIFDKSKYKNAAGVGIPDWRDSLNEYFSIRDRTI